MAGSLALLLVDLVLAITVVEAIALVLWHRATGRGIAAGEFGWNLASGLCLMVTLRMALAGAAWPWIGAGLAAAGLAHGIDLWRRWPRRGDERPVRPS